MKNFIALLLISSQLTLIGSAPTALAENSTSYSPESTLLANVIALQGSGTSDEVSNTELVDVVTQYMNTSQDEGREQRLQEALVQLSIFTPDQAKTFVDASHEAGATLDSKMSSKTDASTFASKEDVRNELVTEVGKIADLHPAGAQFSMRSCAPGGAILTAGIASLIGGIIYSGHDGPCHNGSCPDPKNPLTQSHSANVGAVFIGAGLIAIFSSIIVAANSHCL